MITDPGKALSDLAMKLALSIAPQTTSLYAAADTGMTAMLLQCLAQVPAVKCKEPHARGRLHPCRG